MRRRHAISPGFSAHYRDLGISSLKGRVILPATLFLAWVSVGVGVRSPVVVAQRVCELAPPTSPPGETLAHLVAHKAL